MNSIGYNKSLQKQILYEMSIMKSYRDRFEGGDIDLINPSP